MELNWIAVASEAAKKLVSFQSGISSQVANKLPLEMSKAEIQDDDGNPTGYLLWNSPRTGGEWGQMLSLELSLSGDQVRVVGDDWQPWGNGMDCSRVFASVPATDMSRAAQILCRVAREGFALDTLQENETLGRYERGSAQLPDLSEDVPSHYERQRA